MPLESLSNEQINIKDIALEQEKSGEYNTSEIERKFETLKKTPLYDEKFDRWNLAVQENGYVDEAQTSVAQLLGILIESRLEKKAAINHYAELKESPLYYPDTGKWYANIDPETGHVDQLSDGTEQFLALIVDSQFDKAKARQQYDSLLSGGGFDHLIKSRSQFRLLEIIFLGCSDPSIAEQKYSEVCQSYLYDQESGYFRVQKEEPKSIVRVETFIQLFSVLAQAKISKEDALSHYKFLKDSPLYDKLTNTWFEGMHTFQENGKRKYNLHHEGQPASSRNIQDSIVQLTDLLCQLEFVPKKNISNTTPSLPETRQY